MTKRYTDEDLEVACAQAHSVAGVMRILGIKPAGGSHYHISSRIKRLGIDTSHFTGSTWNRGKRDPKRLTAADILVIRKPGSNRTKVEQLRRALFEIGREYICEECGQLPIWNGKPLVLHVEHKDGNPLNNLEENLCFLCPHCHSQTATYCRRKPE